MDTRCSGGLETLFDNVKSHKVDIPSKKADRVGSQRISSLSNPSTPVPSTWKETLSKENVSPCFEQTTVNGVISYIQKKMLKKQPEMFLKGKEL